LEPPTTAEPSGKRAICIGHGLDGENGHTRYYFISVRGSNVEGSLEEHEEHGGEEQSVDIYIRRTWRTHREEESAYFCER
jgi:hypothetical protein